MHRNVAHGGVACGVAADGAASSAPLSLSVNEKRHRGIYQRKRMEKINGGVSIMAPAWRVSAPKA